MNNYYSRNNIRHVFLDGLLCDTIEKVFLTLASQLSFPDYFGNNLDAFEEMLNDLEWITEEKIKLITINQISLLSGCESGTKESFLSILNGHTNDKLKIVYE